MSVNMTQLKPGAHAAGDETNREAGARSREARSTSSDGSAQGSTATAAAAGGSPAIRQGTR